MTGVHIDFTIGPHLRGVSEESEIAPARGRRRALIAASAAGVLVLGLGTAWVFRIPMATALAEGWLAGAGVDGTFEIERLDLGGARLSSVSLGAEGAAPDFTVSEIGIGLEWAPFPRLGRVRLAEPHLRARISEEGVSLGTLDALLEGDGRGGRVSVPKMAVEISDGRIDLDTPFGALALTADSSGRIGRDFSGRVVLPATSVSRGAARLENAAALLEARGDARGLSAVLTLSADRGVSDVAAFEALAGEARFFAQQDLAAAEIDARVTARSAGAAGVDARDVIADIEMGGAGENALGEMRGAAFVEARGAGDANWRAAHVLANGNVAFNSRADESVASAWRARVSGFALSADGRAALRRAWPALDALPIGPLVASARDATLAMLSDGAADATARVALGDAGVRLAFAAPSVISGASGARIVLTPRDVSLDGRGLRGAAVIATDSGGYPNARVDVSELGGGAGEPITARGTIDIPDWRANGAALSARDLAFRYAQTQSGGQIVVSGPALMSGPLGGAAASVRDLRAPLNLIMDWGAGFVVRPAADLCMEAPFAELRLPGLVFGAGVAPLCAESAGYFASSDAAGVSGGVSIAPLRLVGHMEGAPSQRAELQTGPIVARFSGTGARMLLDARVEAPRLRVALAPERVMNATGDAITAQMVMGGGTWRADGRLENGAIDDATLPANVRAIGADWQAVPRGDEAVITFSGGVAQITDRAPAGSGEDRLAAFEPMRAANVSGTLSGGRVVAEGAIVLEDGRAVGVFDAAHVLESGAGEANFNVRDLRFTPQFQPDDLSLLARGVVANVSGPINALVHASWTPNTFAAEGRVSTENLSFSSATLPIVEDVSGEIVFDDLIAMTTPPRQRVTVGKINPGVEVRDGVIEFQMLPEGHVAIQRAEWPFASGVLAVAPTEIVLGAEETRFALTLRDVDVAVLLAQLQVPDLVATGRVAGQFPLVLTQASARIENGELRAAEGGGEIYYAGAAAREATGVAALAFQALTRFRYDDLSLELNGDLDGDLITSINFSGRNAGDLDIGAGATGPLQATVANVPFIFNVRVTAPFRRLGDMAAGAFDPRRAIEQAAQSGTVDVAPLPPEVGLGVSGGQSVDPSGPATEERQGSGS